MPEKPTSSDQLLREEFNKWAADGRGDEMERHHISIVEQTLSQMALKPGESVLDLGCGVGWASRIMARMVAPEGQVVGIDISDEMISRARAASRGSDNVMFVWGSAQQLPWQENFFDKVLSVESFYYYADQDRAIAELFRVIAPKGKLYILINLYRENHYSLRWVDELKVPVQVRSEQEYVDLLKKHTFENVRAVRVPDETPTPETYSGKWFKSAEDRRVVVDRRQAGF
jgi:ubiquinone/menaquinone biosynthesis C-methylase UbiE